MPYDCLELHVPDNRMAKFALRDKKENKNG